MFWGAFAVVGCLAAKVATQLRACLICQKLGRVEMSEESLAAAVCGRVVDFVEEASRGVSALAQRDRHWDPLMRSLTYT